MQQVEAPHGRLLFPAVGAWGLLLAVGWWGLFSFVQASPASPRPNNAHIDGGGYTETRAARYALLALVVGLFLLALIVPFAVIQPAFALPRLMASEEAIQETTPLSLVYDNQARLLGYRVEPDSATAGARVNVTLCWEALRAMDQDYTLFIHLLGRDNLRVGERTTYPGQGRFPTTLWPVGSAFCDSYWIEVAPWAPAPELYILEVGLYDAATGWRLPALDGSGQPAEPPAVGLIRIAANAPPPSPEHKLSYNLGAQIALVGYDTTTSAASDTLTLTLYWEALQAPQGDYKVFAHLLDATGALVAQDDAPPRSGSFPTWAWQPGDLVPDPHQVTLSDVRPPGPYYWLVGMYHPDTLERLPINGPEGPLPDGAIRLGEVLD
jgi:hypothetical protein